MCIRDRHHALETAIGAEHAAAGPATLRVVQVRNEKAGEVRETLTPELLGVAHLEANDALDADPVRRHPEGGANKYVAYGFRAGPSVGRVGTKEHDLVIGRRAQAMKHVQFGTCAHAVLGAGEVQLRQPRGNLSVEFARRVVPGAWPLLVRAQRSAALRDGRTRCAEKGLGHVHCPARH